MGWGGGGSRGVWVGDGRVYLGAAGGVLGGAAGDEFGVAVLEQVFVEAHVFFFGEDGVVGLEAVFFEHGGISDTGQFVSWWFEDVSSSSGVRGAHP